MSESVLLRRSLASADLGSTRVIDALRWDTPLGSGLRIYFGRGAQAELLMTDSNATIRLTKLQPVGNSLIASGTASKSNGPVDLNVDGALISLDVSSPETALFDDLNVIVGQRHTQSAEEIASWLAFHVTDHEVQGAILVNRAKPGTASEEFAKALEDAVLQIDDLQKLILIDSPLPLGNPAQPALGDPATAPRPKSRTASPDPWLSPLAEPLLYDVLKWRFLTRAGAVLVLEPYDLLDAPGDGIGVYEACRQSQNGLILVSGEAVFAWRIKKGRLPVHADHICRALPQVGAPRRWCVAPKRTGPDSIWLPGKITGMTIIADETASYTRAASVLFSRSLPAELVDKATLSEDARLLARATGRLGHDPVRPPVPVKGTGLVAEAAPSGRTVVVTCMKNEGPFILEWLAYHRMIGVDDFLIYTNDCDDGTDTMLDLLQERRLVQRRDNPFRKVKSKPQQAALEAAQSEPLVQAAGWIISMDVDEFLNIHTGAGTLADLYAAIPGASAISITWRLFGNSDIEHYDDRFVLEQFTRCAPHLIRRPHQAWGFKTLFRNNGLFQTIGVHRPKGAQSETALWVNGSGQPMPRSIFRTGWRSGIDTYGYDLVTLNHYAVRNVESFLVKRDRGRVNHVKRDQGPAYWFRMNNNDQVDLSIQRHLPALQREVDALMADPAIAAAHAASVAAHRVRIAELLNEPSFAKLHQQFVSDRMKRLSRLHRHLGMNVFLQGPSVVPDRILDNDLPPNFFFNTEPPDGAAAD